MSETAYCLGFVFDRGFESVVLTLKERGLHVGMWNGLGGKIEPKERSFDAMRREYKEEANGHEIEDWWKAGFLEGKDKDDNDWVVHVFAAFETDCVDVWDASHILENKMDGTLAVRLEGYDQLPLAPHVPMLIAGCIHKLRNPKAEVFRLTDIKTVSIGK